MKLIKICANKPFKEIRFNPGFNVILGETKDKEDNEKDTHNLGKTILIDVIDFLLLKRISKNHLLVKHRETFKGYVFYLEILLNSGEFLVIRRGVDEWKKVSFKILSSELREIREEFGWNCENINFQKALEFLNHKLNFNVASKWKFRKSISYSMRNENNYRDVFQLSGYKGIKHREWKPILFDIFGFNGELLLEKYDNEEKRNELEKLIDAGKKNFADNMEIDEVEEEISKKTEEKKSVEKKIDDFNFYEKDKEINKELVNEINTNISTYNTIRYNVTEEINKIEKSLNTDIPGIDIKEIKELYEDVNVVLPNYLIKEYKDLEDFNKKISEERRKYFEKRLVELNQELAQIEDELKSLENQKNELLSTLRSSEFFEKFKTNQKSLTKIEVEIAILQEKEKIISEVKKMEKEKAILDKKIEDQTEEIKSSIKSGTQFYKEIKDIFNEIIHSVLNVNAPISVSMNPKGNIEFSYDIQDPGGKRNTAKGFGTIFRKLLCIAFDLSILITYSQRSFYRFAYHDGALEGLDDRKKINLLNKIREICDKYQLQYILTVIDSDLPLDKKNKVEEFPDDEVVLKLHGSDDSGRLFKKSF